MAAPGTYSLAAISVAHLQTGSKSAHVHLQPMTPNFCPGLGGNQRYKVHMSLDVARVNVNELFSDGLQKSVNACQSKANPEFGKCPNIFRQPSQSEFFFSFR